MVAIERATAVPYPKGGPPACREHDPELWFPPHDDRFARQICAGCPLARSCREHALAYDLYGIWGGTSRRERETHWRERGIRPLPAYVHKDVAEPSPQPRPRKRPARPAADVVPDPPPVEQGPSKRCPRCRMVRALTDYYPNAANPDGLAAWCKPCFREIAGRDATRP
ncbi:hypothetical protein DP939_02245 [Spongiactinospora rosea]|uniref:Transcriptional regulator WhiB n=1 Tax=Spongiactinospora rosea TaxID=2248750 RepID=A0A366M5S6_9ACTN|nr:WhiB family transcriptional regulator [Spongiactinospora rosea]RBQ21551.1 hypothetical protein DP939_02245 [Spongiactinospora rosea]